MARVPKAELDRLKQEVSLERLAEAKGVELAKLGKDLRGRCPFHGPDEDPSLSIDPKRNVFHCFGCGEKGTVIDWVMKAEGVSFRHAIELLRHDVAFDEPASPRAGVGRRSAGNETGLVQQSTVRRLEAPVTLDADGKELLEQVTAYYQETYRVEAAAREYLESRGLADPAFAEAFRVGFANRTLGLRLPAKTRIAGAELRGRLQELGIFRVTGHEHLNGCVVLPTDDEEGTILGLYGRKITRTLKPRVTRHLYLPGKRRGVWNWRGLVGSEEAILCESHLDAATFWCAGYRHVTTAWGAGGLTEDHLAAFRRYGTKRVLVAYDRDDAGEKGAKDAAERLGALGIGCFRVLFPKGQDANEYAQKVAPATKSLGLVLRHAQWMGPGAAPTRAFLEGETTERKSRPRERPVSTLPEPPEPSEPSSEPSAPPATSPASEPPSPPPQPAPSLASPPPPSVSPPPPPSSPVPPMPAAPHVPTEIREQEVVIRLGDRRYRIRGLEKAMSYDSLRVNLLASRGEGFHVDTIELYSARHRGGFVKVAAEEMGVEEAVVKHDLGRVLLKLEELQEEQIRRTLDPEENAVVLEPAEREAALELLRDPELLDRIVSDLTRSGLVGEEGNKLVAYLAAVSRKLERPLAVLVQSSSAAGKSTLMDAILSMVPEEERVSYSAMTGQALFYMSEQDLSHKVLAIAEEEGAERASYALKLLQSEGELTIASTGKDPASGRLVTHEYRVEGPVMIFSTTTAIDVDPELQNRCLVLAVDESREQTRAIHRFQRYSRTLPGYLERRQRKAIRKLHQDAQRLLSPLPVINPYAQELTFLDETTRTRRDHDKYLALIETIALLHQYQRPRQRHPQGFDYVEVTPEDVALANHLVAEVLGRSLDELPPQTRRLLDQVEAMVAKACERLAVDRTDYRFGRREVVEVTGWSYPQVRAHLERLVEYEYLLVHRGGRGQSFVYELLYDGSGKEGEPFLIGLLDAGELAGTAGGEGAGDEGTSSALTPSETTLRGAEGDFDPPLRGHSPPFDPGLRSAGNGSEPSSDKASPAAEPKSSRNALLGEDDEEPPVASRSRTGAAALAAAGADEAG